MQDPPAGPLTCPKCQGQMHHVNVGEGDSVVVVDRCVGCGGVFFDMNEEVKLSAMKGAEAVDAGARTAEGAARGKEHDKLRKILCPRDGQPMIPMVSLNGRVHYESCKTCFGAYFDAGELTEFKKANSFLDFFR